MSTRGLFEFPRVRRWLRYRLSPRALILLYHRVTELENDPHLLAVTPQRFAEQMEVIRQHTTPVRLQELVQALARGKIPNRAVVVTFDDGYADNLHQARPVLDHYEVPATVFVTAGQIGSPREFWWDELDRLLLQPGKQYRNWHVERLDDPDARHRLFRDLAEKLHSMPDAERQMTLADLQARSGAGQAARPTHRAMTRDELHLLVQDGLIEVGAHTMTHPDLALLDAAGQRAEIRQSKECLEAILKSPVTSFAYPYGSTTPVSPAILQEDGFTCACSSAADVVWKGADVFKLPRLGVRDWDRAKFTHWLKYWIDG